MLLLDLHDHRRDSDVELVAALRAGEPLALAEAYHRTVAAAHAVARRLVGTSSEVEALLRAVYAELWEAPPIGEALEGWVRGRAFAIAAGHLRAAGRAPASPSAALLLPDLPRPEVRYLDAAERAIAELAEDERRALVLAHDRGVPTEHQDDLDAGAALHRALDALAGPEPSGGLAGEAGDCSDLPLLADHVLGLVEPLRADEVAGAVAGQPGCGSRARTLRRGRRRLEGLPPTPDAGQRVLVTVLSAAPGAPATGRAAAAAAQGTAPGPGTAPAPAPAPAMVTARPPGTAPATSTVPALAPEPAPQGPAAPDDDVAIVAVRRGAAAPAPAQTGAEEEPDEPTEDLAEVSAAILADLSDDPPSASIEEPPPDSEPETAPRPDRSRVFDGEVALARGSVPAPPLAPVDPDPDLELDLEPYEFTELRGRGGDEREGLDDLDEPDQPRRPAPPARRRGLLGRLGRMTLMLLAPAIVAVLLVNLLWSALAG